MSERAAPRGNEAQFVAALVRLLGTASDNGGDDGAVEGTESARPSIQLRARRKPNRAALAALRRGLGKRPGEAPEMFPYVIPYCADRTEEQQDNYFLVAALFALHQGTISTSDRWRTNFGASMRRLAEKTKSASIEQRFTRLLNATRDDLDHHLRQAVALLRSHDIPVDWAQLLRDLGGWAKQERWVQRRWAQSYWGLGAASDDRETLDANGADETHANA